MLVMYAVRQTKSRTCAKTRASHTPPIGNRVRRPRGSLTPEVILDAAEEVAAYGFDEMGAGTLVMVADPEYVAIRIYRSVGFDGTETQTQLEQPNRATT